MGYLLPEPPLFGGCRREGSLSNLITGSFIWESDHHQHHPHLNANTATS